MDPTSHPVQDQDLIPPSSASEPTVCAELGPHCDGPGCRLTHAVVQVGDRVIATCGCGCTICSLPIPREDP
jgi:hypothetical protein